MGNRWLRFGMLLAGCVLLAAGCRLFYLIYHGAFTPPPRPVPERVEPAPPARPDRYPPPVQPAEVTASPRPGEPLPDPSPPEISIVTGQLPMGAAGEEYFRELEAAGVRGLAVWTVVAGELPPGLDLSSEGVISGIPQRGGEWRFTVRLVERGGGTAERELRLLVREDPEILAQELEVVTASLPSGFRGRNYLHQLAAEGGEPPYRWEWGEGTLPEGIRFGLDSGAVFGIPREIGEFEFTIIVIDREEDFAERDYTLQIEEGDVEIVTAALPPANRGELYTVTLRARGGAVPYRWRMVAGRLPEGLEFDPDRGIISGVPEKWETTEFVIRVFDREGKAADREFELAMGVTYYGGPRILTGSLPRAVRGEVYRAGLEADDGVEPYTWTVSEGDLPPSLFLDSATGEISGLPEQSGKAGFTVMVSDAVGQTGRQDFSLVVDRQLVSITTAGLPDATAGREYQHLLEAAGGSPPYFFSLESGRLPRGLALAGTTGLIGGTVSDIYLRQGDRNFRFRVRVTDREEQVAVAAFPLRVIDPLDPDRRGPSAVAPSPRPVPTLTPAASEATISGLTGAAGDGKTGLAWRNPSGEDFDLVRVVRRRGGYPGDPDDGEVVFTGRGDNFVDRGLENRTAYFYAVIPYSRDGAPGEIGRDNRISLTPRAVSRFGPRVPYAGEVAVFEPLDPGLPQSPSSVLGPPSGRGVALHARPNDDGGASPPYGGTITLKFTDSMVVNEPGIDFTVFGRVRSEWVDGRLVRLMKPAVVAVSQDGVNFREFPFNYRAGFTADGSIDHYDPFSYAYGFAGVNPVHSQGNFPDPTNPAVSGGDFFDLDALPGRPFTWINYVRITAAGDRWLRDVAGDPVRHTDYGDSLSGTGSSGFELDAVSAVNY